MKTNNRQFDIFRTECLKWLSFFGLDKTWEVLITHEKLPDGISAQCWSRQNGRIARLILSTDLPKESHNDNNIKRCAFHEVIELLLSELVLMAQERFSVTDEGIIRATHVIVRTLENTIFKSGKF